MNAGSGALNRARLHRVDLVKKNGRFGVRLEKTLPANFFRVTRTKTKDVPQGALIVSVDGIPGNTVDVLAYLRRSTTVALTLQLENVAQR